MRRWLACAALMLVASPLHAQPGAPPDLLDQAAGALDAGEFAAAAAAAQAALNRSLAIQTRDVTERAEAYRILGLSYYYLGRKVEAERAFLELLKLDPSADLDPQLHPKDTVAFLVNVRLKNKDIIAGVQPKKDRRRFAVNLVPPFGQFQNKEPIKGAIVGGLEVALIATNIATFFILRSWCEDDGTCPGHDTDAKILQVTNIGSGLALGGVYVFGVIDGWRGYREWKRRQSSLFEVSLQVVPVPDGAMATVGGRF